MTHNWNIDRSTEHINRRLKEVKDVEIVDYVRDTTLENIPSGKAYKVDGVHLYADILNLTDMLNADKEEGVRVHQRTLRFLNLHYRAVSRILDRTNAQRVDFHNQRLHALIAKPYNSEDDAEAMRVHRAVAIGQMIIDVLRQTGDTDEQIPSASVRVGIDSGKALAVNNGRRGNREPLFLGEPANKAAKIAAGDSEGIYLTNNARRAIGLDEVEIPEQVALTTEEIAECQKKSELDVKVDSIVKEWKDDLENNPIGAFEFSRHTPPFRTMDIDSFTPGNSRRQEAISVYADIAGFTAYVKQNIDNNPEDVVRTLHVIRSELERTFTADFDGRRIRFIGDCLHGLLCEGTAHTTDEKETISTATLCAGGLRSSFDNAITLLQENNVATGKLGLAIGFEFGPMTVTRLGIQGDRIRCSVSRGVLAAENEQTRCSGKETAIGKDAYRKASDAVQELFTDKRLKRNLDYNEAVEALSEKKDKKAQAVKAAGFASAPESIIQSTQIYVKPHSK